VTTADALVDAARRGDPDAWRELYRAHAGRLVVWLGTRAGTDSAIDPEDVAAEAWLTAAGKIASFTGTADDFAAWLFGIARHIAANTRRRAGRRGTDPTANAADLVTSSIADHAGSVADLDWIRHTLAQLPPKERDVLACIEVVGLSVAETGQALGMKPVSVRVAHHRALRRLRLLQAPEEAPAPATITTPTPTPAGGTAVP
jgi:RNA polymerase sigma-70 factor (ECF subfamily)